MVSLPSREMDESAQMPEDRMKMSPLDSPAMDVARQSPFLNVTLSPYCKSSVMSTVVCIYALSKLQAVPV